MEFKIDKFDENTSNDMLKVSQKYIEGIISRQEEALYKRILTYCKDHSIVPLIIEEEKLKTVLELGIQEYNRRKGENEK